MTYSCGESVHLPEALVEREIVSDGVLPARRGISIIRELPDDPVVDLFYRQGLGRGALQSHEYHTRKREWRFMDFFAIFIISTIANIQNDIDHLVCFFGYILLSLGFTGPAASRQLPVDLRLPGLPGALRASFTNSVRRASQSRTH